MSAEPGAAAEYPLAAGGEEGVRLTLHGALVRGGEAFFDDGVLHGHSSIEAGIAWRASRDDVAADAPWHAVYVAVSHAPDLARAYSGVAAAPLWVDAASHTGYRDVERERQARDDALAGGVAVGSLSPVERRALRAALVDLDPDAWDLASEAVRRELDG